MQNAKMATVSAKIYASWTLVSYNNHLIYFFWDFKILSEPLWCQVLTLSLFCILIYIVNSYYLCTEVMHWLYEHDEKNRDEVYSDNGTLSFLFWLHMYMLSFIKPQNNLIYSDFLTKTWASIYYICIGL